MHKIKFNHLISIFFLFVLVASIFSCATTSVNQVPDWILSPSSVYSDSEYLSAVGYGADRVSAENAAIAAISKIIKQNVKSETTSSESFSEKEGDWNTGKDFSSSVKTYSDVVISGIYIQDVYPIKKGKEIEYYALALVNRQETGNQYKSKIQELTSVINEKITEGYNNMGTFSSYSVLKEATELAMECDYYLDILAVINPTYYKISVPDYGSADTVAELARRSMSKIIIGFEITGDIDGRIEAAFSKILTDYGIKLASLDDEDVSYTFVGNVSFSPLDISSESKNKYIRFVLNSDLIEVESQKNVLTFAVSGREAHLTEEEATQRAIRTLENEIRKNFLEKFDSLF